MYRAYVSRYLNSAVFTERCTHLKILSADTQIAERSIHSYDLIIKSIENTADTDDELRSY